MISSLTFCSGGFGTGGITILGYGKDIVAPSLNAYSRAGPRFDSGVAIVRAGANKREPEPHPTGVITYCSPFTENVTGIDSIAEPVLMDQIFFPVSAAYAANSPVPWSWNTRLPVVDRNQALVAI